MKKILCLSLLLFTVACSSNDIYTTEENVYVDELPAGKIPGKAVRAIGKAEVVAIAKAEKGQKAIARLDLHPFNFELSDETIQEFRDNELPEDVVDYLEKRAAVDWDQLHSERLQLQSVQPQSTEAQRLVIRTNAYQPDCRPNFYSRNGFTPVTRSVYRLGRGRYRRVYVGPNWRNSCYGSRRGVLILRR